MLGLALARRVDGMVWHARPPALRLLTGEDDRGCGGRLRDLAEAIESDESAEPAPSAELVEHTRLSSDDDECRGESGALVRCDEVGQGCGVNG